MLVLHGGASRRAGMMVSPTQLSVLRMIPIARRIARAGGDARGLPAAQLPPRLGHHAHTRARRAAGRWSRWPTASARAADLPGRTFARWPRRDPDRRPAGGAQRRGARPVGVSRPTSRPARGPAHSDRARRTRPDRQPGPLRGARPDARRSLPCPVPEGKHAMLRHGREFIRPTIEFILATVT